MTESTFQTIENTRFIRELEFDDIVSLMNSHFSVHTADQQPRHYVPAAFQTLQSLRPNPRHQSPGLERTPDHPLDVEDACLGMTVHIAAAVVDQVPETMKNAGKPEVNLGLAVGLVYMQDE